MTAMGRWNRRSMLLAVLGFTAACSSPAAPTPSTGLSGVVVRGPITPVCVQNVPCSAPFSAAFSVEQGGRIVSQFRSDADGRFSVPLAAGAYVVVPAADAPLLAPTTQTRPVTVGANGFTEVRLEFDTGLR
jgi:hypothetical protein